MAITVFSDVVLSSAILSSGVSGKNIRLNSRVPTDNGYESVNVVWTQTLREYTLGVVPLRVDQWQAIETLHEITEGGAYGMLLEDPKDSSVSDGVATAISAGVFQLHKRYLHSPSTRFKTRKITRPRASGFVIRVGAVTLTSAEYALDVTTGRVTIVSNPAASSLSWTGRFDVPVHFMDDTIDWDMVVTGAAQTRYVAGPSVVLREVRE
jgi:uncharacterized protein (TIGR02217 family)